MTNRKLFISLLLLTQLIFLESRESFAAYVPVGTTLGKQIVTSYWPGAGGKVEGGWETSKPGPTGQYLPSTLEMVRKGESNYVTIAGDRSHYGEWYTIPEISYVNTKGELYTLRNVPAYVHDTGSAFQGRKDKFDIAVDRGTGFSSGDPLDRLQSQNGVGFQGQGVVFKRTEGSSNVQTTSCSGGASVCKPTPKKPTEPTTKQPKKPIQQPPKIEIPTTGSAVSASSGGGFLWDARDRYCHKHTGAASASELKMAMTCNAGFKCVQTSCGDDPCYYSVFVKDCGPRNANCDSAAYISGGGWCPPKESNPQDGPQAGCLNYKCKNKPNAIWDMGSKKCGCG